MAIWLKYVIAAVAGYLLGNASVGILISKLYGVMDIRRHGSGNAGSTNVLRTLGWVPSLLTLLGDCLKAYLAAELGRALCGDTGMLLGGVCAVLGHDFPVFFRFHGGKGIASSLGVIIAVDPWIALALLALVVAITAFTRYVSVGSICASILYPVLVAALHVGNANYGWYVASSAFMGALALFCHRKNIVRLLHGEENRLDFGRISKLSARLRRFKNKK